MNFDCALAVWIWLYGLALWFYRQTFLLALWRFPARFPHVFVHLNLKEFRIGFCVWFFPEYNKSAHSHPIQSSPIEQSNHPLTHIKNIASEQDSNSNGCVICINMIIFNHLDSKLISTSVLPRPRNKNSNSNGRICKIPFTLRTSILQLRINLCIFFFFLYFGSVNTLHNFLSSLACFIWVSRNRNEGNKIVKSSIKISLKIYKRWMNEQKRDRRRKKNTEKNVLELSQTSNRMWLVKNDLARFVWFHFCISFGWFFFLYQFSTNLTTNFCLNNIEKLVWFLVVVASFLPWILATTYRKLSYGLWLWN